ncbi:MAG: LysR family transcriptional regulator [Sphingomonas sp. 28-66-16]|nr:MAG: LysR family transcriptional regulator [Sphingomonas sp. 28-66-16]
MAELNYNHLRYFWSVAHDGNLTRTAVRLGVSQSALSVQIRKLEDRLGQPLFERRSRQMVLTEAGRIALDHADSIFATGSDLVGTLRRTGVARQPVRIGALATLSRNFQIDFLRPILGRGDIDIVLRSGSAGELLASLAAHGLDAVLTNQPVPADTLTPYVTHRLSEQPVSLVGMPGMGAPGAGMAAWLDAHPVIVPTIGSSVRTGFDALVDRLGLSPQIAAEVDDMAMMRLLAREGAGLAVLPAIVVKDELADGSLIELERLPGIAEQFLAITVSRKFPNPVVTSLIG